MENDTTSQRTRTDAQSEPHQDDLAVAEELRQLRQCLREDSWGPVFRARVGPVIVVSAPLARMLPDKPLSLADPHAEVPPPNC